MPPEPRLQTNPREDLSELRASEDELLDSYGWVDKNAGVVRIPIDEAMKLTLRARVCRRAERSQDEPMHEGHGDACLFFVSFVTSVSLCAQRAGRAPR